MRVVLAGGSGFIGRPLCRAFFEAGHEVFVLSRKDPRATVPYARVVSWDGASPGPWQDALEGATALINLCGANIADGRWTQARKRQLRESRLLSTALLVKALHAAKNRPEVFLSGSAVGYYGDRGDEIIDERCGPGADFLARLCFDWEAEAHKAPESVRAILLRTGVVLGGGGGALAKMLLPFRLGLGGPLGSGSQWMPWISREDVVGLILHLIDHAASGPVNLTAPQPATNAQFSAALGRALRRPAKLRMPAPVVKLAFGEMSGVLLGGQRALPNKAKAIGYTFKHPAIDDALAAALR